MLDVEMFELSDEMKSNYINRRLEELNEFKKMNDVQKVQFAQHIGHKIAGSAQSFGFLELEPIAKEMERLRSTDVEKCRQLVDSLEKCVARAH